MEPTRIVSVGDLKAVLSNADDDMNVAVWHNGQVRLEFYAVGVAGEDVTDFSFYAYDGSGQLNWIE